MNRAQSFPVEPNWRALLVDLGVRPADVLRRASLPEDLLGRSGAGLSTEEYFRFWSALEAEVGEPCFPIRLVEALTTEAFLPPLFAALCSPNLVVAAERLAHYKRLIAPMALHVLAHEKHVSLTIEWLDTTVTPPSSLIVLELAFVLRLARIATRAPLRPLEVVVPHALTPHAPYAAFFGIDPETGPAPRIAFSRADAERPFLTANEAMWRAFEPELRKRLAELDSSATTAERVRAALFESLPSGQASIEQVARRLALSKRTLQRRLQAESTSFQRILDETREDLARHYLTRTAISCAEISFLLGFEDPNSFFRAFQAWTGTTPERLRQTTSGLG